MKGKGSSSSGCNGRAVRYRSPRRQQLHPRSEPTLPFPSTQPAPPRLCSSEGGHGSPSPAPAPESDAGLQAWSSAALRPAEEAPAGGSEEPTPGGLGNSPVPAGYARPDDAAQPGPAAPLPAEHPARNPASIAPGPRSYLWAGTWRRRRRRPGGARAERGARRSPAPRGGRPGTAARRGDGRGAPPPAARDWSAARRGGVVTASAGRASLFSSAPMTVK